MTITVIECGDKAQLDAYRQSPQFLANFPAVQRQPDRVIVRQGVHLDTEVDDQGTRGDLHWLIVEDDDCEDNATFRLEHGVLRFHATGVEV